MATLVLVCGVAAAQPNTVTYQGVLRDTAGNPVADGPYAMSFGIFATDTGGTLLWTEPQTVTTSDGAFSVQLGAVTPLGTLFADNAGGALWLEVSADGGVGMQAYSPRVPLTHAPYAFHAAEAANADTLDDKHASEIAADISSAVGTHNTSGTAHSDIRSQIGTDIGSHNTNASAHANIELDAARITPGTLSNDRLNMGHDGGIDADKLDGWHQSELVNNFQVYVTTSVGDHNASPTAHAGIRNDIDAEITAHNNMPPYMAMNYIIKY